VELSNYLKTLLYNHDTVIIPDLGALITHYKAAEINSSEKTISPPTKYLLFDQSITQSDNLLVKQIAALNQINLDEANNELKKLLDEFIQKLNNEETILLEGVGYFSKENNKIRFEKEQDANYLTESFGLSKIDFEPIDLELTSHIYPILSPRPRKNYTWLVLTTILLFLAGGAFYIFLNYPNLIYFQTKNIAQPSIDTVLTVNEKNTTDTDTSIKKSEIETFFESTTDKKNALSIQEEKKKAAANKNMKYYIIAGSFKTTKKAEILAREIEKDGFKPQIIKFENFGYRISLGEFTDFDLALKELEKIRANKGDNTVWILKEPL
jgi:nucleoid DNA-binding protein